MSLENTSTSSISPSPAGVLSIKTLTQKDNHTFTIEWGDGLVRHYRLSDLQKTCPCAGCVDEMTGNRRSSNLYVDDNVRAKRIFNIGRYALKIEFASGCSSGIFSFDRLYSFKTPNSL